MYENMSAHLYNTTDPPEGQASGATVDQWLWMCVSPFILVIGLAGNILIILVIQKRKVKGSSMTVYLPLMAVMDSATLVTGIIPEWLEAMGIVVFKEISGATCKLEKFLFYVSADTATWILVLFTFDRFVAVGFPLKKRRVCNPKRAKIACAASLLLAIAKNLHVFWTRGPVYDAHGNLTANCGRPEPHTDFELYIRPWIAFTLANAIPFIIIIVCNIVIIRTIVRAQRRRREQQQQNVTMSAADKTMMQTVAMCLSASFTFLVCITPSMALLIGRPYWTSDGETNEAYDIAKAVNNQLVMVNHSVNVFLYSFTGQKFREELFLMFRCDKTGGTTNNSSGTSSSGDTKAAPNGREKTPDRKNHNGKNLLPDSPVRTSQTFVGDGLDNASPVVTVETNSIVGGNNERDNKPDSKGPESASSDSQNNHLSNGEKKNVHTNGDESDKDYVSSSQDNPSENDSSEIAKDVGKDSYHTQDIQLETSDVPQPVVHDDIVLQEYNSNLQSEGQCNEGNLGCLTSCEDKRANGEEDEVGDINIVKHEKNSPLKIVDIKEEHY